MGKRCFIKRCCTLIIAAAMLMGTIPAYAVETDRAAESGIVLAEYTDGDETVIVSEDREELAAKDAYTPWTETSAHYDGPFPVSAINENGSFRVEYSAETEAKIVLILSDYSDGGEKSWISVEPTEHGGDAENGFWAEYSYAECAAGWGSGDFSDLKAICVQNWGDYNGADASAVINRVFWYNGSGGVTADIALDAGQAFYGKELSVVNAPENAEYIWHRTGGRDNFGGTVIEGAEGAVYVPSELDLGMAVYCEIIADGESIATDAVPVFASEDIVTTELYSGSAAPDADGLAAPIYMSQCGYRFNHGMIAPGGSFRVTYTQGTAELCLSEWNSGKWVQVTPSESGEENGEFYAVFDYDDIEALYGSDFSQLSAVQIKLPDADARVTSLSWSGYDTGEIMHIIPYTDSGEITGEGDQTSVGYAYLKHAGGEFDTTLRSEEHTSELQSH